MNETGKLRTVFLWALLPIVCFALAIPLTNWIAKENDLKTSAGYKNIAWEKVIVSSPDVVFQDPDSIKYWTWELRVSAKKDSLVAADITHLFPEFKVRKLTAIRKIGTIDPDFEVWNYNGTVFYGVIVRCNSGDFALATKEQIKGGGQLVPLGRFKGRINDVIVHRINKPSTTMNVVATVTLLLCLLGCGIAYTSFGREVSWLYRVPFVTALIALLHVVLWILDEPFWGSKYFMPEWITLAYLISEVGLLSGVIYRLYAKKEKQTMLPSYVLNSRWEAVSGNDSLIINNDGTLYYTLDEKTLKYEYKVGDNGDIIISDKDGNIVIAKLEGYSRKDINFNGKLFGINGISSKTRHRWEVEENKKNMVRATFSVPKYDEDKYDDLLNASWKATIFSVMFAVLCFIAIGYFIATTDIMGWGGRLGISFLGSLGCFLSYDALKMLLKQTFGRKRYKKAKSFDRLYDKAYLELKQPELTDYLRAALKNPELGVEEWKSQNNFNKEGEGNAD